MDVKFKWNEQNESGSLGKRKYFKMLLSVSWLHHIPLHTFDMDAHYFVVFLVSPGCDHTEFFFILYFLHQFYRSMKTLFPNGRVYTHSSFFFVYKYRWLNKLAKTISSNKQTNKQQQKQRQRQHYKYSPWFIIIIIIILCIQALSLYSLYNIQRFFQIDSIFTQVLQK